MDHDRDGLVSVYLATNTAFSMLALSHEYVASTTEAGRAAALAASQAMLAVSQGTGGQYTGMPLAWLGGMILSIVMLRSTTFNRATAWAGVVGLALLLASVPFAGYTTAEETTPIVTAVIAVTYIGGGLLSLAWYISWGCACSSLGASRKRSPPRSGNAAPSRGVAATSAERGGRSGRRP